MDKQLEPKVKQASEVIAEKKQEHKFLGSQRKKPGLQLFEWDMNDGEVRLATMESHVVVDRHGKPKSIHKVIQKQDCVYLQALNLNNAIRKCENKIREAQELLKKEKHDTV